jgi:hypothetical protein
MRLALLRGLCLLWLCSAQAMWGSLPPIEGTEDIRALARNATFVFHAQVVSIVRIGDALLGENLAELKADRWYKGTPRSETVRLQYLYPGYMSGHDCIDLQRSSSWLIFAEQMPDGTYRFSEDCEGGLPMSPILAAKSKGSWLQQLQQDLIAGLEDPDPDLRLANIVRLGGLKLRSSGDALREFVENGSDTEVQWAIYAALRSGDPRIFPRIEKMATETTPHDDALAGKRSVDFWRLPPGAAPRWPVEYLESSIWYEIGELSNPEAVPMLARIAKSGKNEEIRSRALGAIRFMHDFRALPALVDLLSDPDANVRFEALWVIAHMTGAPECQLDEGKEASIESCKSWWQEGGGSIKWPAPSANETD